MIAAELPVPDKTDVLPLWQCLAISVGVPPKNIGLDTFLVLDSQKVSLIRKSDPEWLIEMSVRLQKLTEVLADGGTVRADQRKGRPDLETPLHWAEFLMFARRRRWTLPDKLSAPRQKPDNLLEAIQNASAALTTHARPHPAKPKSAAPSPAPKPSPSPPPKPKPLDTSKHKKRSIAPKQTAPTKAKMGNVSKAKKKAR